MCQRLLYSLKKKKQRLSGGKPVRLFFSPTKKACIGNLKKLKNKYLQLTARSRIKICNLQSHLYEIKQKMNNISNSSLSSLIETSGLSTIQSELIEQIFAAAKLKNSKNRRYTENWMLLCILFQIR